MSAATNQIIDQQNKRTEELKRLIANHGCPEGPMCDELRTWEAELNGERYE